MNESILMVYTKYFWICLVISYLNYFAEVWNKKNPVILILMIAKQLELSVNYSSDNQTADKILLLICFYSQHDCPKTIGIQFAWITSSAFLHPACSSDINPLDFFFQCLITMVHILRL